MKTLYTPNLAGCWADGSFGHDHIRFVLSSMVEALDWELSRELLQPSTDDMSEEDDAIALLNEHCEGCSFGMRDGDLMLLTDEQWEEE